MICRGAYWRQGGTFPTQIEPSEAMAPGVPNEELARGRGCFREHKADTSEWPLIAPSHELPFDEMRGILGNAVAMRAYRQKTLPFPDAALLVKFAWKHLPSTECEGAFRPCRATTIQAMFDSKCYAAAGGWGFGRFVDGKPVDQVQHESCFGCHAAYVKDHDFVFTRYAL